MEAKRPKTGPTGFIIIGPNGDGLLINQSDNKAWLTLFYQLPREILDKRSEYYLIPRCPYEVLRTDKYDELINQDRFLELIWDSYAWAIWNNFQVPKRDGTYRDIPGLDRFYSGDYPLWRLAYYCVALMRMKFQKIGLGFQELYNMPPGIEVPFLSYQHWWNLVGNSLDLIIEENYLQPVIDEIWRNRTLEDYSEYYSRVKKAFEAQWYHTRTNVGRNMMSLEQLMEPESEYGPLKDIDVAFEDFVEDLVNRVWSDTFLAALPDRDREILKLKLEGYTDQEIAEKVSFKTHSAVVKRLKKIRGALDQFIEDEYNAYRKTFDP